MATIPIAVPAGARTDEAGVRHGWRTLAVSGLAVLAVFLDTTVLFVAFPDIQASFPAVSPAQLSWVLNGYTIVFAAMLVPLGKVADRIGHKRAFLTGSALFTAASLLCAVAGEPAVLIAFRVVQALGGAMLIPSSLALVMRAFPPERIPVAIAIWGALGAVAGALGPTLGAAVVESVGWRWVFALNLPVGILTVLAGRRILAESADPATRLPAPAGAVLVASSVALLSLGVVQSDEWGWSDGRTLAALASGAALVGLTIAHQRRSPAPAIDLDLFRIRNFAWGNAATLVFGVAFTAMFFGSILFLTTAWQWSVLAAGFGVAPGPLLVAVLAPRVGGLAARVGQRPLLLAGGLSFAFGGFLRLWLLGPESDYLSDYLPSMLFTGLGVSLCLPQLASVVAQALPPDRLGVGGATNQAVRQFGGTFGVALTIAMLGTPASIAEVLDGFDSVWWLIVAGGLLTSVLSVGLRTRRLPAPAP